jgi:zinc protease
MKSRETMSNHDVESNINSFVLTNGLKVIHGVDSSNPLVSIQLHVRMGSCWEKPEEAGYSHLTEHLVFKSTEHFTKNSIMEAASFLGGSINAYTEFDSTCFYLTLPSDFLEKGMELLAELVFRANYTDSEFKSERSVVIEELKQYRNDPEDYFIEEIPKYYFEKNPYKRPIIGTEESLGSATPEKLRDFYHRYYVPDNCFLVITGDVDIKALKNKVFAQFGSWRPAFRIDKEEKIRDSYPQEFRLVKINKMVGRDLIAFTLPELSEQDPDSYTLSLITKAFAVGKNSRLHKRLYDHEQMVEQIKVHSLSGLYEGISVIEIVPKQGVSIDGIISCFIEEFDKLRRESLSLDEIRKQKQELQHSYRYSFEYVETLGMTLASEEILGSYKHVFDYLPIISAISGDDCKRLIEKYYRYEYMALFQMGKTTINEKRVMELVKFNTQPVTTIPNHDEYREVILDNGMKLILKKVKGKPTIGISIGRKLSQLNETEAQRGINLLMASSLLYGNEKRDYNSFLEYCLENGINVHMATGVECTTLKVKCFSDMLSETLQLIKEVLEYPLFTEKHIQNLKKTFISNLLRIKDYPHDYASMLWKRMLLGRNSNLINREGKASTLHSLKREDILDWFAIYRQYDKMNVSIVGDIDMDKLPEQCNAIFSKSSRYRKDPIPQLNLEPSRKRKTVLCHDQDQSIINWGGFGCTSKDKEKNTASHVLAQIIGGEINSRMFDELREKLGIAYSVGYDFNSICDIGYFLANAIVDRNNEKEAMKAMEQIFKDIRKNSVKEVEIETARNFIRGQRLQDEESVISQSGQLAMLDILGFDHAYYLKRDERLRAVNKDLIHQIAEEYFREDNYHIHIFN